MVEPSSNIPVPDPSLLTTEQLRRELSGLREILETRLAAMDRATDLIAMELARVPSHNDRELASQREYIISLIDTVRSVSAEKFAGIDTRFLERDERTAQAAQESRISLDAALAAAKEAVSEQNKANALAIGKSELATKEKLDALERLMVASTTALADKISGVIERVGRIEARGEGKAALWALLAGVILILIAASGIAISLVNKP